MTASALAVIDIAQAGIARGQRAWTKIKATAEEQRTLWLEVGVALMYGKQKGNRAAGQKFSDWVQAMFPGLPQTHASNAIWWAENSNTVLESVAGLTHPQAIRRAALEQQTTQELPSDLQSVAPTSTPVLSQRDAEKVSKVLHRATSGDEGAGIE